jgi:hypothetical protein
MASWGEIAALLQQINGVSASEVFSQGAAGERESAERIRSDDQAFMSQMSNQLMNMGMDGSLPMIEEHASIWGERERNNARR